MLGSHYFCHARYDRAVLGRQDSISMQPGWGGLMLQFHGC